MKETKKSKKIQNGDNIILYIYALDYDYWEKQFTNYFVCDGASDNIVLYAEGDTGGDNYPNAIFQHTMSYSNGIFRLRDEDPSFILDEDFKMSKLKKTVYNAKCDRSFDSIYVLEKYGGEEARITDLIFSANLSLMLKTLVDKVIDWREYSEEDVISEENEWLQMALKLKNVDKHNENTIIYLKMFDGKTLNARILNDGVAKELEEICKSKNIELKY